MMDGRGQGSAVYAADSSHSHDGWVGWREGMAVYAAYSSHSHDGWVEGGECCVCSRHLTGWVGVEGGECCVCSRQLTLT